MEKIMKKLLVGLLALGSLSAFATDSVKDSLVKARKTIASAHKCQIVANDGYGVVIDNECVSAIVNSTFEILKQENRLPAEIINQIKASYNRGGSNLQAESTDSGQLYQYALQERTFDSSKRNLGVKYQLKAVESVIKALENMY